MEVGQLQNFGRHVAITPGGIDALLEDLPKNEFGPTARLRIAFLGGRWKQKQAPATEIGPFSARRFNR